MRGKKSILLLSAFCLSFMSVWAERIDFSTARKVAERVANESSSLRSSSDLSLVYVAVPGQSGTALRSGSTVGVADYFVFNFAGDRGFAIVAGDDRVLPILGYSDEGTFDPNNLPENLSAQLAYYQDQISWAVEQNIEATPDIAAEWNRYLSGTALRGDGGVLLKTANWYQDHPYNMECPYVEDIDGPGYTGCVATAMGIVMKYHQYPQAAVNPPASNTYYVAGKKFTKAIDYSEGYDWDNMLDNYGGNYTEAQGKAVAHLLFHCGVNVEMEYMSGGSGSNTILAAKALTDVFGYSPSVRFLLKDIYSWSEWKEMLRKELSEGYPMIYEGKKQNASEGHAFVCDGYDASGLFHINWGWNGISNGYYQLSVLGDQEEGMGYSVSQRVVMNIRPESDGDLYYYPPYLSLIEYEMSGLKVTSEKSMICYLGLFDHTYNIGLGVVNADGTIVQEPIDNGQEYKLEYNAIGTFQIVNSYSLTLSEPLLEGQYVTMLCSADGGETWEVMRTDSDAQLGINANGPIIRGTDDPDEPAQTVNVWILDNDLDDVYLSVSGLDLNESLQNNTGKIEYGFNYMREKATLRYTIKNYDSWKGHITIYSGNDESISAPNSGTLVKVSDAGVFEILVSPEDLKEGNFAHYLKMLTDRKGELEYDIEVYTASDLSTPVFERKVNKVWFINSETAISDVSTNNLKVWAANGNLHVQTPVAEKVYVVGLDGRIYKVMNLPVGETVIRISSGVYIIYIGGESYKISF